MPALRERGVEPIVATLRHRGRHFEELAAQSVETVFVAMRSRHDVPGIARAYRLWRMRPDVVFSSSVDAQVLGQAIAARAGARHVTAEHGGVGIPRSLHRRLLVRLVAPRVDRAVAVSASQTPELIRLGFAADRIAVIPNGIPVPEVSRTGASVRRELGLADDDVVALFAATLRPEKNAGRFVDAVLRAHRLEPRLRAVIAGAGPELESVRARVAAAPDVVHVLGERGDVGDLLVAADVVCLTSTFEGLPMTVLEAMALGRPVIATRVGGLADAVEDGLTGRLVPPDDVDAFADALVSLASAPKECAAMGEAGRRVYEARYTLERMVDAYAAVLVERSK